MIFLFLCFYSDSLDLYLLIGFVISKNIVLVFFDSQNTYPIEFRLSGVAVVIFQLHGTAGEWTLGKPNCIFFLFTSLLRICGNRNDFTVDQCPTIRKWYGMFISCERIDCKSAFAQTNS